MNIPLAVLADYANQTADGKVNIMGIFSEVNPPQLPFQLTQMFLVVILEAAPAEAGRTLEFGAALVAPDGNELMRFAQPLIVPRAAQPGRRVQMHFVMGIAGTVFQTHGDYMFSLQIGSEERGSVSFRIHEPQSQQQPAAGS